MRNLLLEVNNNIQIINVDESSWRVYPTGLCTWAKRRGENIALRTGDREKNCFIVVAAITAARTKLPLPLIVAGKTAFLEYSHFGDIAYHRTDHSQSGWTTYETFERWLIWVRHFYADGDLIWIILDCFSVHRQEATKSHAVSLGINLLFIPPGITDEFQS
jgi:hypothetical protein